MSRSDAATVAGRRAFELGSPIDLRLTLGRLRHGIGDPTVRFSADGVWRATRTPQGPATLNLVAGDGAVEVEAWGAGASWALEGAPALVGVLDDPAALRPEHAVLAELQRRLAGLRIGRTAAVLEALVPAILEQKVTGLEARRAYRALVWTFGERAPGPAPLMLPPDAKRLAALPYYALHRLGIERRRADTIRHAAAVADRLEEAAWLPADEARRRVQAVAGIGPWTAAEVAATALGDPDAVSVGDYHLPRVVAWNLAGEPRADDARMLELLEPYRGQRGRVIRLLEAGGRYPPRRGARLAPRSIAEI